MNTVSFHAKYINESNDDEWKIKKNIELTIYRNLQGKYGNERPTKGGNGDAHFPLEIRYGQWYFKIQKSAGLGTTKSP